jgi:hypothetical protein
MPNARVPAAGEAMPAEGQEPRTLVDIEDEINDVRQLIEAAHMAAVDLSPEQTAPMQALLDITQTKLTAARDGLSALRGAHHV